MAEFRKEQEEKRRQEMAKVPGLIQRGEAFKAKEIMTSHSSPAEQGLWRELAQCFEREGILQTAMMIYNRDGYNAERDRVAGRLGLTGHVCCNHADRQAIGRCEKCGEYFCIGCGEEWANHFACNSCLAESRRDWTSRLRGW